MSCSADTGSEVWTDNGNEIAYADYVRQEIVYTLPKFILLDPKIVLKDVTKYKYLKRDVQVCERTLVYFKEEVKYPADVEGKQFSFLF